MHLEKIERRWKYGSTAGFVIDCQSRGMLQKKTLLYLLHQKVVRSEQFEIKSNSSKYLIRRGNLKVFFIL